ncbi:MAG: PAS domain-containing protein [Acidobacteriota bacterium]|nr:PAS domain-containing protein [Acidobacteriota bacterium]
MTQAKKGRIKLERRDVEFRLRERERFLRMLITNLPGAVFQSNTDAKFTKEFVSDGCFDLTGYRAAELVGANAVTSWNDLIYADDRERVFGELRRLSENQESLDGEQFQTTYRLVARDKKIKYVRDRFRFVHDSARKIKTLEGFTNDVSEQRKAEEALRVSENRYKLLAENMRDLVCLHDLDANFVYVSPSSEVLLGYAPEELVGVSIYDLIHAEDVELIREAAHERLLSGEISSIAIEHRMRDKRGAYCWFETMWQTVAAPGGEIIQLQTVSRDVAERREAEDEREKAQKDLAQLFFSEQEARRDADVALVKAEHASRAKDEFLQMVSHEFRTPLTTIKTLVRVLQHDGKTAAERRKYLEIIAAECDRQIDMILNLLDVSRFDDGDVDLKHEAVNINRVLNSCDKIERSAADSRRQTLTFESDESLPPVCGDEKAIRRALCTIVENAIKYTPEGGNIRVKVERVVYHKITNGEAESEREIARELFGDLPERMDFPMDEKSERDEIAVIVSDDGRGILPEDIPKIFQKFYRGAKPHADASTDGTPDDAAGRAETPGVGLGLYLAKRLITALDGRVTAASEVGRGSCFTIYLPVWNEDLHEKETVDEYDFDER